MGVPYFMQLISPGSFQFQKSSKFALLTIYGAYADFHQPFKLANGAWIMTSMPVADFGVWKEWLGSLRAEQLSQANLVVIVQEHSEN